MTDHVHSWSPIAGEAGRYLCACGRTGWRTTHGHIHPHRKPYCFERETTANPRDYGDKDGFGRVLPHEGQP